MSNPNEVKIRRYELTFDNKTMIATAREVKEGRFCIYDEVQSLELENKRLREALEALPDFDLENPDSADFVDHSKDFIKAMRLAIVALTLEGGKE